MIVTTKKVICKSKIFDEDAIELEIIDDAAGCYLAVGRVGASEHEKITFDAECELDEFYRNAKRMLISAQVQCDDKEVEK